MISTAQVIPSTTLAGLPACYAVGSAELLELISFLILPAFTTRKRRPHHMRNVRALVLAHPLFL
jgi:hypothetical protein